MQIDIEEVLRRLVQEEIRKLAAEAVSQKPTKQKPPMMDEHGGGLFALQNEAPSGHKMLCKEADLRALGMIKIKDASKKYGVPTSRIWAKVKDGAIQFQYAHTQAGKATFVMEADVEHLGRDLAKEVANISANTIDEALAKGLVLASRIEAETGVPASAIRKAMNHGQFDGTMLVRANMGAQQVFYYDRAKVIAGMKIKTRIQPHHQQSLLDRDNAAAICGLTTWRLRQHLASDGSITPVVTYQIGKRVRQLFCPQEIRAWAKRLKAKL